MYGVPFSWSTVAAQASTSRSRRFSVSTLRCCALLCAAWRWWRCAHLPPASTGLTSTIGVPSTTSSSFTRTGSPSTAAMRTRCRPIGFGRSGDRVLNRQPPTPLEGAAASVFGWPVSDGLADLPVVAEGIFDAA